MAMSLPYGRISRPARSPAQMAIAGRGRLRTVPAIAGGQPAGADHVFLLDTGAHAQPRTADSIAESLALKRSYREPTLSSISLACRPGKYGGSFIQDVAGKQRPLRSYHNFFREAGGWKIAGFYVRPEGGLGPRWSLVSGSARA